MDLRNIDPLKIKKVRNVEKEKDPQTKIEKIKKVEEFFMFNDKGFNKTGTSDGTTMRIAPEMVTYTTSGLLDYSKNVVIGYLHKDIEDCKSVINDGGCTCNIQNHKVAPERRIYYIDVGNLPKEDEQYLADVMNKYRNKLVYNAVLQGKSKTTENICR